MNKQKEKNTFKMGLQGKYKVAVVDAKTNQEIWRQPEWGNNLILNQGMDALISFYLAQVTEYGIAGAGTRFNSIGSGDSNGSVGGGQFVLQTGATGIQDLNSTTYGGWTGGVLGIGDVIKFNDSTEVTVTAFGALSASVTPTTNVSTQSFTIWKTSATGLQTEIKRSNSYLTGVGNCGTTVTGVNTVQYLRTYNFSSESIARSYTEVGVSWDNNDTPIFSTFSRILLPQTISIDVGQALRLIYQLNATFTPASPSGVSSAAVSGWPVAPATNTNMSQSIQNLWVSTINTSGVSSTTTCALEPASLGTNCAFWGSTNSASLTGLGDTIPNRGANGNAEVGSTTTADSYTAGSFRLNKNSTFSLSQLNYTYLKSFGFGAGGTTPYSSTNQAFAMVFEQTQSKFNTQTLSMTYRWNWSRTLSD